MATSTPQLLAPMRRSRRPAAHGTATVPGLATRLELLADLEARHASGTADWLLGGFRATGLAEYEADHGEDAAGELLGRLAARLALAVSDTGKAYWLGEGRFAVLARFGRGGSGVIVRACRAALVEEESGIAAEALTAIAPVEQVDPADAVLTLARDAAVDGPGSDPRRERPRSERADPAAVAAGREPTPTLAEARGFLPAPRRELPRGVPYLTVRARFAITVLCGLAWMALSAWLAQPWIAQLSAAISLPAALAVIAGLALIPGYLNVQLISSLLLDHPTEIDPGFAYRFPELTLLVAAYNEERTLAQTLAYALGQDYPGGLSVIVIDDGSADETARIARNFARLDDRVAVMTVRHGGKAAALNAGLQSTATPLVATIDADTLLMPGALRRIVARMLISPSDTAAIAGSVMVRNSRRGLFAAAQSWDYFLGIGSIKRQQALLQGTLVAQGAFSLYETSALRAAEGWPDCIGEDIVMTWALLDAGGRTTYEPSAVAYTEAPTTLRHLARQRSRWARGMIEGLRAYGLALIRRRRTYAHAVLANALFPYLDFVFTFAFLPGVVLALTGNFMIVGPMTLAVLPLNVILGGVMYRLQRRSLGEAGLRVRSARSGLIVFFLLYQAFMSPVSVSGYLQEALQLGRRW